MSQTNILLAANYSNDTGYAWNNIYRLFNRLIQEFASGDMKVYVTFAEISPPVKQITADQNVMFDAWDPNDKSFSNTIRICKLIQKNKIKYIYLTDQNYYDWRYLFFRLYGAKKIVVHNRISVADPYPAKYESGLKGMLKAIIARTNYLCASRVYAVSGFVKNRLVNKNRVPENKVVTILNGIDITHFRPVSHANPSNKIIIFTGGRATKHKGIHILIDAVKLFCEYSPDTDFVVRYAGDGPELGHFKSMVSKYELDTHFEFLGELGNTQEEVTRADIIVVPSIWGDACPSSVSEALASGKPLIATSAGGIPEIVGNKNNAFLVPPGDCYSMSIALLAISQSRILRQVLSRNARERAESALDQDNYYKNVIAQLRNDLC